MFQSSSNRVIQLYSMDNDRNISELRDIDAKNDNKLTQNNLPPIGFTIYDKVSLK